MIKHLLLKLAFSKHALGLVREMLLVVVVNFRDNSNHIVNYIQLSLIRMILKELIDLLSSF